MQPKTGLPECGLPTPRRRRPPPPGGEQNSGGRRLGFWYSAQHALSGVTPVLVVDLNDAALVDDALSSDDLPVLTLHAPQKGKPDVHREWRLATAHYRDALKLQRCIKLASADRPAKAGLAP